ncbi:MAG: CinA family nicotinamide mononucleotide deamidase-related protein [Planctomycetes bacterium]|nr:CinA family nicotinamide mononucleotide deamidase-related protein [Planctomycetota bacterium]
MTAEVIAVGDELTSGERLDTNSQWISQRLAELGVRTLFHTTVGDELEATVRVFRAAGERADVIVVTGGLGPTADDLTREALAAAFDRPLVRDEAALSHIRSLFNRRGREMPERNVVQAMFPRGSRIIPNAHGTAPGIDLEIVRAVRSPARYFCLPGVPAEMKEMWRETVAPAILDALPGPARVIRHYCLRCFGAGESHIEQMLPDLIRRGRQPSVGITAHQATITLRVTAEGESEEACRRLMQPTLETIRRSLGDLVYGEQDEELQHVVARGLSRAGKTLAVAEWGTGGLVTHWLSDACGDHSFLGGTVIRNRNALCETLQVSRELLESRSEYSCEVAAAMAERCREQFGADLALAVGPFPPPAASAETPSETHFALATADAVFPETSPFTFHPDILQARTAKQALNALRLYLATRTPMDSLTA